MKPFNESEIILGNFVTHYKGDNYVIRATKYQLFSQQVRLFKNLKLSENFEEKMCFQITLIDRNYLMVLDYKRLYAIEENQDNLKYIELGSSVFSVSDKKVDNEHFLIRGRLQFFIEYGEKAAFFESFDFQLIFDNDPELVEALMELNNNEFEF